MQVKRETFKYMHCQYAQVAPFQYSSKMKLVMVGVRGDSGAYGTTEIVQRYVNGDFTDDLNSTRTYHWQKKFEKSSILLFISC